jgi:serine/threonine protein kinase
MGQSNRDQIFISYAHEDARWRDDFLGMLAPAHERGLIGVWSDGAIAAGENWSQNIQRALERARVGLLLVTPNFLQSKFITRVELTNLLSAAKSGGVSIRWVPVSASLYQITELASIQACCPPDRPLDELSEPEQKAAIQKICLQIVEEFGSAPKVSEGRREALREGVQARLGERYTIMEEIGTGKFSVVYRAERQHPKRTVGIKTFVASELDEWARRAFIDGVERAVELGSPAFIKILDHFMDDAPEFLVSEFVQGEQLNTFLRRYPDGLPLQTVKSILLDLARAIEEAHQRGWRRGEMCPSDILIEESGLPRISPVDFANVVREQAQLSGTFLVDRESLSYMTPERYFGQPPTLLTDQYSLALIGTDLLGGPRIPRVISASDLEGKRALFADLESGKGAWAKRSPEFAGVLCRMLRVDPEQRWQSMTEVRDLLREIEVAESPEERERKIATSSYVRIQAGGIDGERTFFTRFYKNFFAATNDVEHHFQSINMERQYQILNRAIHALLSFRPDSSEAREHLAQIASRHASLGLTRQHYDLFLDTFVKTIDEMGESEQARLGAWRATLKPGIDFLWQCENANRAVVTIVAPSVSPSAEPATPTEVIDLPTRAAAARRVEQRQSGPDPTARDKSG